VCLIFDATHPCVVSSSSFFNELLETNAQLPDRHWSPESAKTAHYQDSLRTSRSDRFWEDLRSTFARKRPIPPAEAEANYYRQLASQTAKAA
jgi:hypothetical protein